LWNVVNMTYAAILVPNEILGRVIGAAMAVSWGVMPLGSLAAGHLLSGVGSTNAVWILAAVMLLIAVAGTVSPAVRRAPPLMAGPSPTGATPGVD
jgi:hypothetical protein